MKQCPPEWRKRDVVEFDTTAPRSDLSKRTVPPPETVKDLTKLLEHLQDHGGSVPRDQNIDAKVLPAIAEAFRQITEQVGESGPADLLKHPHRPDLGSKTELAFTKRADEMLVKNRVHGERCHTHKDFQNIPNIEAGGEPRSVVELPKGDAINGVHRLARPDILRPPVDKPYWPLSPGPGMPWTRPTFPVPFPRSPHSGLEDKPETIPKEE